MRVPYSWLREVVSAGAPGWDVAPSDLAQTLVSIGHEVEYRRKAKDHAQDAAVKAARLAQSKVMSELETLRIQLEAARASLEAVEHERLPKRTAIALRNAPLLVMVAAHGRVRACPGASLHGDLRNPLEHVGAVPHQRIATGAQT